MPSDASDKGQILIVEDRVEHAVLLRKVLEKGGYRLLFAENGARVFYILDRELPDLILLDLVLPDMEGYDICEKLKADQRTRHIPVIFISALSQSKDKIKGFAAGGADFITKPFYQEEVLARVHTHMALRKHQQSLVEKNAALRREIAEREKAEDALKEHRGHLERLVEERTCELAAANAQLRQEIEVRKGAEARRALDEQRLSALWRLSLIARASVKEIADYVLENIVSLTGSRVGFLGFIDADKGDMILHAWSKEAMRQCAVKDTTLHFSLKNAGIWADAVRMRRAVMINDYNAPHDGKKGFPEGHVLMHRFLSVPVFDGDRIVMAASVANKADDYDGGDVRQITLLADGMWKLIRRKQAEDALKKRNKQLEILRRIGDEITSELQLGPLLESISSRSLELFNGLSAGIAFHRADKDMLEVVASAGDALHAVGDFLSSDDDFIGEIFKRREALILADYGSWEKRAPRYAPTAVTSIMGAPLCWGEARIGVIVVRGRAPGAFAPEDGALLFMLGTTAAIAIRNAQLFDQVHADARTKAELLKEVNHRVSNNLASISGLLSLERDHLENEHKASYRSIMEDLTNRVNALANVHAMLSSSAWSPLNLAEMAENVALSSLKTLSARDSASVHVTPSPVRVNAKQAHNLALIINELTTNTVKYAVKDAASACIFISVEADDGRVLLEFRDDGPGYPDAVRRLEAYNVGINLTLQLTRRALRGSLSLENRPGAAAVIRFPAESE